MYKKIDTAMSFYKFIDIKNLDIVRSQIYKYLYDLNIFGTVIIASEGINANFCGTKKNIELSENFLSDLLNLGAIHYNRSRISNKIFTKLKVKIKDEIIK